MAKSIKRIMTFSSTASRPRHALVLIYDLAGFSKFFNQPDVQDYVPRFLNHISDAIKRIIFGGPQYWLKNDEDWGVIQAPVHEKFLGDGMLYIWTPPYRQNDFDKEFVVDLTNRIWNIQNNFDKIVARSLDDVPVRNLPNGIRFGLTRGTVFELTPEGSHTKEYIGFCINLASRLQKYCPDLAFIASARIGLPKKLLNKHGYIRVVGTKIRGFPDEILVVDKDEFSELDEKIRDELFDTL